MGDWDKLIVSKGFKKWSKVQKIAQSGHTDPFHPILRNCEIVAENFDFIAFKFGLREVKGVRQSPCAPPTP